LDLTRVDVVQLGGLISRDRCGFTVRALARFDLVDVLALDGATVGDYLGGIASSAPGRLQRPTEDAVAYVLQVRLANSNQPGDVARRPCMP
jgi:hypothetical protein